MKVKTVLAVTLSATLFIITSSFTATAHEEHGHGNGHHGNGHQHNHAADCDSFLTKESADIPDFLHPRWEIIKKIKLGHFYTFYRDLEQPHISVAAMTVVWLSEEPETILVRITWQVDEEIRTVRREINEMVCAKTIVTKDGQRYDLGGFMKILEEAGKRK